MAHEEKLLKEIEKGDSSSLDELVRMYYPDILRYCLWHTYDRETAKDAAQQTFLKMVCHFDCYAHRGKFKAYLYKIAANVCTDMFRKKVYEPMPDDLPYSEIGFEKTESNEAFSSLIQNLTDENREIMLLRFAQDLTVREIADVVELPMRTVQSRLRSALKQIKKELKKGGESLE